MVGKPNDHYVRLRQVRAQVEAYLAALAGLGVLSSERYFVECNAGNRGLVIIIGFQPPGCSEPVSLTLHQGPAGCRTAATAFAPVMENCA